MQITEEWLTQEIANMEKQRQHAHEVAIASQAAIDVLSAIRERLRAPEPPSQG
jgi:hypothetical protein